MNADITHIPLVGLVPSLYNPRKSFDPAALEELKASILEVGILTPLLVRPLGGGDGYEIIAGERRFRAAESIGLSEAPCMVRSLSDDEAQEIQIIDNLQRADVHPLDEARAFKKLSELFGNSGDELATRVGKPASYIAESLNLLNLGEDGRAHFIAGTLTIAHARLLAKLTPDDQGKALDWLVEAEGVEGSHYSQMKMDRDIPVAKDVKLFRHWIDAEINMVLINAPWDKEDATLVEAAGPCTLCPKNSGANRALFPELQKTDTCTDRACFRSKLDAYRRRMQKATRKAEKKDFLLLSTQSYLDQNDPLKVDGVKNSGRYNVITEKSACEFARKGQYIDGKDRGKIVLVCNYSKCPKHYGAEMKQHGRSAGPSAKAGKNEVEARRQRNNSRYEQAIESKLEEAIDREIFKSEMRDKVRIHLLRAALKSLADEMSWNRDLDELAKAAGWVSIKALKTAAATFPAAKLIDALLFLVARNLDYQNVSIVLTAAKEMKLGTAKIKTAIEKDLHRCEVCRCSEISACMTSGESCSWRKDQLKAGKYICTGCEIPGVLAGPFTGQDKAPPAKTFKPKKGGKK